MANNEFPKNMDSVTYRKEWFDKSIGWLHVFNCELTAACTSFPISNTKIKRWMKYVYISKTQMESIKKSDIKRVKKK